MPAPTWLQNLTADPVRDLPLLVELLLLPVGVILGYLGFRLPRRWLHGLVRAWGRLAHRRSWAVVLTGLLSLGVNVGYAALVGLPQPRVHDEFSYLLAADTYAHGRLTNPTHPLWVHFESFHIIQQPTYMSKFLPGQGLFLALGQVLCGQTAAGVWLSLALASAAVCWMLQAWLRPRWALLGGLLAALHPSLVLAWGQSYWGGAVAMLGGALLFGAWRRLLAGGPNVALALVLSGGLVLLALTRPLEGLLTALPAGVLLLTWLLKQGAGGWVRVALPVSGVLATLVAGLAWNNLNVTGDARRLAYQVHEETYGIAPVLILTPPRAEPAYRHAVLRDYHTGWPLQAYRLHFPWQEGVVMVLHKASVASVFFFHIVLALPLLMLPWLLRDRWCRFAFLTCLLPLGCILVALTAQPHYAAPLVALLFFLLVQGLRQLRVGTRRRPGLEQLAPLVVLIWLASSLTALAGKQLETGQPAIQERPRVIAELERAGGPHLVVVRYLPGHSPHWEWVYNAAAIDAAPIVWARDLGPTGNGLLLDYFHGRRVWLLEVGRETAVLRPYPAPGEG